MRDLKETYLISHMGSGFVAPVVGGVVMSNPGTKWDWGWGMEPTHWMPLPEALSGTETESVRQKLSMEWQPIETRPTGE